MVTIRWKLRLCNQANHSFTLDLEVESSPAAPPDWCYSCHSENE